MGFPAWDSDTGISTYGPWRRNAAARTAQSGWMTCAPPTITRLTACSQQKVADCVCLFGLHHVEAFPVDTHVKQIVNAYYPGGFPLERYRGYAGILQQYMFYYKLNDK